MDGGGAVDAVDLGFWRRKHGRTDRRVKMVGQNTEQEVKTLLEPLAQSQDATIEAVNLSRTSMGQVLTT